MLTGYVNKVALHAYKTLDEGIEALKNAGYSEDAIFELTLSAAICAGQAGLDRGLAALICVKGISRGRCQSRAGQLAHGPNSRETASNARLS